MPSPSELKFDPITADWTYIRWLGDRKAIEEQTMTWDKTIVDRTAELSSWVDFCYQVRKRGVLIYAFANNHFSGHAPATIEQFRSIWQEQRFPSADHAAAIASPAVLIFRMRSSDLERRLNSLPLGSATFKEPMECSRRPEAPRRPAVALRNQTRWISRHRREIGR